MGHQVHPRAMLAEVKHLHQARKMRASEHSAGWKSAVSVCSSICNGSCSICCTICWHSIGCDWSRCCGHGSCVCCSIGCNGSSCCCGDWSCVCSVRNWSRCCGHGSCICSSICNWSCCGSSDRRRVCCSIGGSCECRCAKECHGF